MKHGALLAIALGLLINLSALLAGEADVDPVMTGTWEVSGVSAQGPWKLRWEIREDSSYVLSGLFNDSGVIGSGEGRWHIISNITKQTADGTYALPDPNHMVGTGPLGTATWVRVGGAVARATPPASSEWNPFANVFSEERKTSATPPAGGSMDRKPDASPKPSTTSAISSPEEGMELVEDSVNASQGDKNSRARLEEKARSGSAGAQLLFGELLHEEKNFAEAMKWFRKAAEQGEADAMTWLGSYYRDGNSVAADSAQAAVWFRKAADRGDKNAMAELGACYWAGKGVEKNAQEAINWWKQAAEKGDENAKENLSKALEQFDESGRPRTRK